MSSGVKRKTNDEIYSMFLVPKRLYHSLIKNIEDDETKKELISMNEKPNTSNYIENAINFKNLQDRQKMNQSGDKLYRFGSDKISNVMPPVQVDSSMGRTYQSISRSTTAQTPQQKENIAQFSPTTPIMEREPDPDLFYTASRPKSQDDTSTPDMPEWRNLPVIKALTQRNSDGKIVCPFTACGKHYVNDAQFGKHIVRDHKKELSIVDTEKISKDIASVSSQASKSPSAPMSSLKTGSGGAKKKTFTISPVQTRSKSKNFQQLMQMLLKKNYFFRENT